jgi:hypothetical protein
LVIEGYLRLPVMGTNCKSGRGMLNLISELQGEFNQLQHSSETPKPGSGANAMEPLPDKFRGSDLQPSDGNVAGPNTKLRIVGDAQKTGDSCQISVATIDVDR